MRSSTRAVSLETDVSTRRPTTDEIGTTTSTNCGLAGGAGSETGSESGVGGGVAATVAAPASRVAGRSTLVGGSTGASAARGAFSRGATDGEPFDARAAGLWFSTRGLAVRGELSALRATVGSGTVWRGLGATGATALSGFAGVISASVSDTGIAGWGAGGAAAGVAPSRSTSTTAGWAELL
jgi:hypothetical protein